ncbi:MAG TPA: VOC family protein [Candidatus Acidoferrales bacterium]|nr:VOC family protein [Candidatus Acidoferrales bacterium]
MAKIKHVAIRTADPERTAAFYKEAFDLKQVGLGQNGIYLSDGHINLAILKSQGGRLGVDHLGFQVDEVEKVVLKVKELGGKKMTDHVAVTPTDPSSPQSYYEVNCLGPDDQVIDISSAGWVGTD